MVMSHLEGLGHQHEPTGITLHLGSDPALHKDIKEELY